MVSVRPCFDLIAIFFVFPYVRNFLFVLLGAYFSYLYWFLRECFPYPHPTYSLIGIFVGCFPLEARYFLFGLSRSIIGHLAYLIFFLCSRRYLAESSHAISISSCCRCLCRRLISCSLFAISCCRVLLFLCAYSSSSISFCVPHFPSFSVHSCSFVIFPFY